MDYDKKGLSKKQKKSLLKTFLMTSGITLGLCGVMIIAGVLIYNSTVGGERKSQVTSMELTDEEKEFEQEKEENSHINKTIAVFGVDEDELRTDVVFAVNFNSDTGKAKVISIPRDTKVIWTDKQKRAYEQLTGYSISVSKLTEMAAYGRINQNVGNIRDFTVDELENILKVKIDNYVVINLDAFREIVDAIGGVDINVPQNMNYDDYSQDLHIHLTAGMQHLDAEDAEGLVRFRQYTQGDEQRVVVQQLFLKAVAEKVLSPEMRHQLPNVVTKLFPYVKTDVKLTEILSYLELLDTFDLSDLEFFTVPGYADNHEGPSYYYIDEEKLPDMIKEVFFSTEEVEEADREQNADKAQDTNTTQDVASDQKADTDQSTTTFTINKNVSIELYNGAGARGLAAQYRDILAKAGYTIGKYDNYKETNIQKSIIYAKDKDKAEQFKTYLESAEIIEDSSIKSDIMIVLGKDAVKS